MKRILIIFIYVVDILFLPLTLLSALWLKFVRKYIVGLWHTRGHLSRTILLKVGVFPILDHYYEPMFNIKHLKHSLKDERNLPGININENFQLEFLENFNFNSEIIEVSQLPKNILNFSFDRGPFRSGDAEYLFNIIRAFKPKRIMEIGCGASTLLMQHAIQYNKKEVHSYSCDHICIEPYEQRWLERLPVRVIRELVEVTEMSEFEKLEKNDILFIDSSHIIRPQGDVLFEYLQILPILKSGVLVHIHDIFSPRDYLDDWMQNGIMFWNEQYLLEAFLSMNKEYEIIGALNYLKNNHFDILKAKCPLLTIDREPGSFWIRKL
jgi:hypothetical protein